MENYNISQNHSNKVWSGLFLALIGFALLLDNLIPSMPNWVISWRTLLIAIGLFVGIKQNFRGVGWMVMVLIGAYFTLDRALGPEFDLSGFGFPLILVALGLYIILKPSNNGMGCKKHKRRRKKAEFAQSQEDEGSTEERPYEGGSDYLNSVNVFGGSHQTIYSKNFKGGEIVAVFGGCDVNLSQADFEGTIELEITAIFGGAKIIVPPGWEVKPEVTAIFGGIDDKRSIMPLAEGNNKLVIVKGVAIFGGVDIRNF
ncbi:hypothetical protein D9M68_610630 [compost metagenome]